MPIFMASAEATLEGRRAVRGPHLLYFDAEDHLAELMKAQPDLKLMANKALGFGCFMAYVGPLLQLAQGSTGFPALQFQTHVFDDGNTLDPAWKMVCRLMRPTEWDECSMGTFLERLRTAKERATTEQARAFEINRPEQFMAIAHTANGGNSLPGWLKSAAYVMGELFASDGRGALVASALEYYAETRMHSISLVCYT